jgi:hypothetical protein
MVFGGLLRLNLEQQPKLSFLTGNGVQYCRD